MNVLIIGRGAVAISFAARLAVTGNRVVLADTYGTNSNMVVNTRSPFHAGVISGKIKYSKLTSEVIISSDIIIFCVKLFQLTTVYKFVEDTGGADKFQLYIQNGFIEDVLPKVRSEQILVLDMACRLLNQRTSYSSVLNTVHASAYANSIVKECLLSTGYDIQFHEDLSYQRLRKFVYACTSAWMAVNNLSIEEAYFDKVRIRELERMMDESKRILEIYAETKDMPAVAKQLASLGPEISQSYNYSIEGILSYKVDPIVQTKNTLI